MACGHSVRCADSAPDFAPVHFYQGGKGYEVLVSMFRLRQAVQRGSHSRRRHHGSTRRPPSLLLIGLCPLVARPRLAPGRSRGSAAPDSGPTFPRGQRPEVMCKCSSNVTAHTALSCYAVRVQAVATLTRWCPSCDSGHHPTATIQTPPPLNLTNCSSTRLCIAVPHSIEAVRPALPAACKKLPQGLKRARRE